MLLKNTSLLLKWSKMTYDKLNIKKNDFWKILLYLKENTFDKTSVPKRKQFQNKVKQTFEEEKTSVPKKNALEKNTFTVNFFWQQLCRWWYVHEEEKNVKVSLKNSSKYGIFTCFFPNLLGVL